MKALVRKERQPGLRPEEVPEPEVGIGDVLIRVDRTGFCGTDLHSTNGTWFSKMKPVATFVLVAFLAATALPVWSKPLPPDASLNLKLAAPVKTWDEALPLGDGAMGVLLWGETNLLRLSLDRGDLWDERPSPTFLRVRDQFNWASLQRLVASNRIDEFNAICDANYNYNGSPTKLPAGRIEITLDPSQKVESFELNLATAEGVVHGKAAELARAFVNAADVEQPVALIRIHGPPLKEVRLKTPASVKKLGYPAPLTGEAEGLRWFEQPAADGFSYAICAAWKRDGDSTLLAMTVATSAEGKSSRAVAQRRVEEALKEGYEKLFSHHADWWAKFWEHSSVNVPEPDILRHYYLVRYFYGAASPRVAPPMPLQGVWSADAGSLPPWKGDYHNDLNTQMTYLAYRTSGDFDEGLCFLDFLWDRLPVFRKFAKDFYHAPGAAVPGVMSLAGQPLGGWGQYSLSPTMGAWNAHLFYLHWRHTGDKKFLLERAYPFCREIGNCLRALLKPDTNGVLVLPLSSSPEIFDNSRRAFLKPNSNYDLASMKMLFLALAEMADAAGDEKESLGWAASAKQLGELHVAPDGTLLLDESTPLPGSHRHLSNLMALHPFNLVTVDGGERDRQIIAASLKDWDSKGTGAWCGYTFSWMSCLRARVGDAEAALRNLDIFVHAFILRNGFHANGDQTKSGFSDFTYRPFTLEGNFLAMEAVHEMLLQGWSPTPGRRDTEIVRIFPATPWRWHDVGFENLRAEGGWIVSARRENNATTWFKIWATRDGVLRVRDNFGGREPKWNLPGVAKADGNFEIKLKAGQSLEAELVKPKTFPPAPANVAAPVVINKES
jgi:alpha-L-fucosidase 2